MLLLHSVFIARMNSLEERFRFLPFLRKGKIILKILLILSKINILIEALCLCERYKRPF